jgi:2-polyprenyl-3-methyl-5-hydroxy-6-metoxy-1,4-benzoquinol methylase
MDSLNPIKAERFLEAVRTTLAPAKGTYIYDACIRNYLEKFSPQDSSGYVRWLSRLLPYLAERFKLSGKKTLDLGCGTGELTVLMKLLGVDAIGLDVHQKDVLLAKLLAEENGLSTEMFVWSENGKLPFESNAFDIVTMISVIEHMDDDTLAGLIPELARVCSGVVFVQAPNKLSVSDDHTGLKFVPWMPHWLAKRYVAARGDKYNYSISASGSWDVHFRNLEETISQFGSYFDYGFAPPTCSFPEPSDDDLVTKIGKNFRISSKQVFIGVPLPWRRIRMNLGYPKEAYYPYLNLIFTPKRTTRGAERLED